MPEYCLKCGAELREGAEFCEECGKKIIKSETKKTLVEVEKEIEEKVDAEFREKQEQEYRKRREKELRAEKERALRDEKEQAERDATERMQLEQIEQEKRKERERVLRLKKQEQELRQKRRQEQKEYFYSVMRKKKTQRILLVVLSIILIILIVPNAVIQITAMQENQRIADEAKRIAEENSRIAEEIRLDKATSAQLWIKTYGGAGNDLQEFGPAVGLTSDGGYILTGDTESFGTGSQDAWLIKTDANGTEQWNKTFGGASYDAGFSVSQTKDDGYIIVGWTRTKTGNGNAWLVKTDSNGNEQWNKTFGGSSESLAFDGCQTLDGGYIITGNVGSNMLFIKTDENGNEQWNKSFGKGGGRSVQQTTDGGYIIVGGNTTRVGEYLGLYKVMGGWLVKTDIHGDKQWDRTFENETFLSVKQTFDGGYIIASETQFEIREGDNIRFDNRISVIKTDDKGNQQWHYILQEPGNSYARTVLQTTDGGYVVAGYGRFIKIDDKGNKKWNQTYDSRFFILSVLQTKDGGFVISGESQTNGNDIFLLKTVGRE